MDNESPYYVDASAEPGGDGSKDRPFRSTTEAVEAHARFCSERGLVVTPATYYLAPGSYTDTPMVPENATVEGHGQEWRKS